MNRFLLCALFLSPLVESLAFPGPSETHAHGEFEHAFLGWTPRPTSLPPDGLPFHRRAAASSSLLGYVAPDNTCGYIGGSLGAIRTCDTTATCLVVAYNSRSGGVGCCGGGDCFFLDECVNYDDYYSSSKCDNACRQDTDIVKCTKASLPYCFGYSFTEWGASFYQCDSISTVGFFPIATTFNGEKDIRTWSPLYGSDTTSRTIRPSPPTTSNIPALPTTSSSPLTPTPPPSPTNTHKSTPVGAIVGGVIGGLAVVGLVAIGAIFLLMHRKKDQQAPQPPPGGYPGEIMPMAQPPMGQPPMGQPPMGQPPMGQPPMGQPPMAPAPMGQVPPPSSKLGETYNPYPEQALSPAPRYSTIQNTVPEMETYTTSPLPTSPMPQPVTPGSPTSNIPQVNPEGSPVYQLDTSR